MDVGVLSSPVLTRKGLCALLKSVKDFRVVLEADSAIDRLTLSAQPRPVVFLLDTLHPEEGVEAISRVLQVCPDAKLLLLIDSPDEELELRAVRAGCQGCLSKTCEPKLMERALRAVGRGEMWVSHGTASRMAQKLLQREASGEGKADELTQREWEVLRLVADGLRNKEIASRLSVSENTIKTHLCNIYSKLHVSCRMAAALHFFHRADRKVAAGESVHRKGSAKGTTSQQVSPKQRFAAA